jgi:hypothetical protein
MDLTEYELLKRKNREHGYIQVNFVNDDIVSIPIYEIENLYTALRNEEKWFKTTDVDGCDVIFSLTPDNLLYIQLFPADFYALYCSHVDEGRVTGLL